LFGKFAQGTLMSEHDARRRSQLAWGLLLLTAVLLAAGLAAGSEGWSLRDLAALLQSPDAALIVGEIRAPRTLGAWLVGALLGLAGAVAQGLFRNPLADPYLLGSASGASLGVVLVLAAVSLAAGQGQGQGQGMSMATLDALQRVGLVGAAFAGALLGVGLTLLMGRGTQHTLRLLLAGVVVGVMLSAVGDMVTTMAPDALRGKQAFLLGSTGFLSWGSCMALALGLLLAAPVAWRLSRLLDALSLGEDSARSLGVALPRVRLALVVAMALATGVAVSQAGLIGFVGLVAPHLVRRFAPSPHGYSLLASAGMGGCLLLLSDVLARSVLAPVEVPVGVLTAVLGGSYLLWLLHRRGLA
jgi:iron complex transport system permease protein